MARLILANGEEREVRPENGKTWTLKEWYELLDCTFVEHVHLITGDLMLFPEDGKQRNLPVNTLATRLLMQAGGIPGDFVAGPVLVCPNEELDRE